MRFAVLAAAATLVSFPALADDQCKGEVEAAFVKQRAAPAFRTVATTETPNGDLVRTIDFVAPDKLYSKIVAPLEDAPVETIGIGKHAWANTEGGWEEQPPHMAQIVTNEREAYKLPPKAATDFECLGEKDVDGKKLLGYVSPPQKNTDGREVSTTIYIDPASGLPAHYITTPTKADSKPVFQAEYSYDKDITIISPVEAAAAEDAPAPEAK